MTNERDKNISPFPRKGQNCLTGLLGCLNAIAHVVCPGTLQVFHLLLFLLYAGDIGSSYSGVRASGGLKDMLINSLFTLRPRQMG